MDKILKEYDIVRYRQCIYLVKNFEKIDSNFHLSCYFSLCIKNKGTLTCEKISKIFHLDIKYLKPASDIDRENLISRIKLEYPNFDLSVITGDKSDLSESVCIAYLKNKGYLVYKQM